MAVGGGHGNPHQGQVVVPGHPGAGGVALAEALHRFRIPLGSGPFEPINRRLVAARQKETLADGRLCFPAAGIRFCQKRRIRIVEIKPGEL